MPVRAKIVADERGMMLIMAGLGMVAFMAATMLALDVGVLMSARSQAQSAADAGALAGAVALYYDDWDDRSSTGPAVRNAIAASTSASNHVMNTNASVEVQDVTFPAIDRVRVLVHRTSARQNPMLPFIGPMFGITEVDLRAAATAQVMPANAMTCVLPFTIPDKWDERQTPPWDPTDTFDAVDNQGRPLADPDVYVRPGPGQTGYTSADFGTRVTIKASNGSKLFPSFYFPYSMGGVTGANEYEWNIANCNQTMMGYNERLVAEPGNMVGPTKSGVREKIAADPYARWDSVRERIVSDFSPSPRVAPIPLFDPMVYDTGKRNGRGADLQVAQYVGIFIEEMRGDDVIGVIVPVGGVINGEMPTAPAGGIPKAIVLVQ